VKREALTRLQQLVARSSGGARADLSLKAGERALKDIRTALGTIRSCRPSATTTRSSAR
jgi:hypothetical protein